MLGTLDNGVSDSVSPAAQGKIFPFPDSILSLTEQCSKFRSEDLRDLHQPGSLSRIYGAAINLKIASALYLMVVDVE